MHGFLTPQGDPYLFHEPFLFLYSIFNSNEMFGEISPVNAALILTACRAGILKCTGLFYLFQDLYNLDPVQ